MPIIRCIIIALLLCLQVPGALSSATSQEASSFPTSAAVAVADGPTGAAGIKGLFSYFKSEPDLLSAEEAFSVRISARDANTLVAEFKPAHGYFIYRDRIHFRVEDPPEIAIQRVLIPQGKVKADPTFGDVAVLKQPFSATVALQRDNEQPSSLRLVASYQGCSEKGVCYPPVEKRVVLSLPGAATPASAAAPAVVGKGISVAERAGESRNSQVSSATVPSWLDADRSVAMLQGGSLIWVLLGFFGFGLLLSLTPCVWPMIPVLSGVIAGQGTSIGRARAFWLSLAYVLGMAVTYAAMGVAAGLSGTLLSTALQTPWAIAAMVMLFVVLALSMFGLYEFQMPTRLQNRLLGSGPQTRTRTSIGVFGTGAVSAIIVGPCIAAPLAGALLYIGQTQDVILGGSALFALALGKGVPLIIIGTSVGSMLPRAGSWMKQVKVFLGVLLLGTAVWLAMPLTGTTPAMAVVGVILVCYAVYLCAFDALPVDATGARRLGKGLGLTGFLVGAIYLVGAAGGSTDFTRPLAGLTAAAQRPIYAPLPFQRVASTAALDLKLSDSGSRYVMLDFYADWCISCKEMEYKTFSDPKVRERLKNVVLLQADVTANSAEHKQLLSRFKLFGPPAILFFDPSGQEIPGTRVIGFMNASRFSGLLDHVLHLRQEALNEEKRKDYGNS